jgi:6-phosphofructokinase 1
MPKEVPVDPHDPALTDLLKDVMAFKRLTTDEIKRVIPLLRQLMYDPGELVFEEGDIGTHAYVVAEGEGSLEHWGRITKIFKIGDLFGEIALIDARPRTGTVRAMTRLTLYELEGHRLENLEPQIAMKIYQGFARLVTSYIREGKALYREMDVLLIQDGGCAPGYNAVTSFIVEYLEKIDRQVFIAAEGFKSIVSNHTDDYRCLIHKEDHFRRLEHIPGVMFAQSLRLSRGADFRSERYPQFKEHNLQKIAAQNILERKVKVLIGIGGDGTFAGIHALSKLLPEDIQIFFIPVTIDSDIFGSECIGEYTGVEIGAEKIRCYMADAATHKRCYIIEMMGAHGGYHALHSCLGAGGHFAVLPNATYNLQALVNALKERTHTVIVVAEGYKEGERKHKKYNGNAAEYFRDELLQAGLDTNQRVVCEGFSRDIRGAAANNMDMMLAQRMARKLAMLVNENLTRLMPAVLSNHEYSISFKEIKTDNSVESDLASLANRLY